MAGGPHRARHCGGGRGGDRPDGSNVRGICGEDGRHARGHGKEEQDRE